MLGLFGLDPESIAESQVYEPGKGRKKDLGDHIGDGILSILTGTDYSSRVEDAAKENLRTRLTDTYGPDIDQYGSVDGYGALPDLTSVSESAIKRELQQRKGTKDARTKAAVTYGIDIEDLKGLTDPGDILSAASELNKEEKNTEKLRLEQEVRNKENRLRTEAANIRAHESSEKDKYRAFENQQNNARLAHEANQNNLTRQYQTDVAKYDANTKLQLGVMESADRRADRAARREDAQANQRIASINALIKGLTQMGAGFAI